MKVLVLLYCVVGIAWYYGQDKLMLHPTVADSKTIYSFSQPFTELNLNYDEHTNINIVEFSAAGRPKDSTAKGVVLYFHGNGGSIPDYAGLAKDFTSKGYECWLMDYPGFGKSTGEFSEKRVNTLSLVFYKLARSRWKPSQIILYGQSLGTGVAAQLASVRDCKRLILQSPYYSMTSLFRRYLFLYPVGMMLHNQFPTYNYLPAVTAPITIFSGSEDETVPYHNSERLKPLLKTGDEFVTIIGGKHKDLPGFPVYQQKLDSLLSL